MACQHSEGGYCIACDKFANSCCGDDKHCSECGSEICYNCYGKYNETCPVCAKEIVTNDQLFHYLLDLYKLDRAKIVEDFRQVYPIYKPIRVEVKNARVLTSDDNWNIPTALAERLYSVRESGLDFSLVYTDFMIGELRLNFRNYIIIHGFYKNEPLGIIAKSKYNKSPYSYHMPKESTKDQIDDSEVYYLGLLAHFNPTEAEYPDYGEKDSMTPLKWYNDITKTGTDYSDGWWHVTGKYHSQNPNVVDDQNEEDEESDNDEDISIPAIIPITIPLNIEPFKFNYDAGTGC